MDTIVTATGLCIIGCAVVPFYKALEQVMVRKPSLSNYALLALLLCIGCLQLSLGLFFSEIIRVLPFPLFVAGLWFFISTAYLAGPLGNLYYVSLTRPRVTGAWFHFIPFLTVSLSSALYVLTRGSPYLEEMHRDFFFTAHERTMHLILGGAVISIVWYTARILSSLLSAEKNGPGRLTLRWLIVMTSGLLISPLLLYGGFIGKSLKPALPGALMLVINSLLLIVAQVRYREFFLELGNEVRLARYKKYILKKKDMAILREGLRKLMDDDKYYHNFDINMKSTAEQLSVTPHQLSWYLNRKLHVDFRKYINGYRVDEARRLLVENLDQNVLTIGFSVGFGSKTSFNVTFKEFTGRTPREYREEHLRGKKQARGMGS